MRLEQLDLNKIKIFITFDDLFDRGLTKDKIWRDIPEVHQLFRDMMLAADHELGFRMDGPISVNVFSLQAQGMVIIITKSQSKDMKEPQENDEQYIEMQVTIDEIHEYFYEFADFEDVIALSRRLYALGLLHGQLYVYHDCYYLNMTHKDLDGFSKDTESLIALLSEFGNPATLTSYQVQEYGNVLMTNRAIEKISTIFS